MVSRQSSHSALQRARIARLNRFADGSDAVPLDKSIEVLLPETYGSISELHIRQSLLPSKITNLIVADLQISRSLISSHQFARQSLRPRHPARPFRIRLANARICDVGQHVATQSAIGAPGAFQRIRHDLLSVGHELTAIVISSIAFPGPSICAWMTGFGAAGRLVAVIFGSPAGLYRVAAQGHPEPAPLTDFFWGHYVDINGHAFWGFRCPNHAV